MVKYINNLHFNTDIYRIKHFFLGNIMINEARGQVILPEGR